METISETSVKYVPYKETAKQKAREYYQQI